MSFLKRFRIRLAVGLIALIVTMLTSSFAGRELGVFPIWVICWIASMVSYIALCKPIVGMIEAAKENESAKEEAHEKHH